MVARADRLKPFLQAWIATALSGALYALAYPPVSWKPAAWLALAPFFLALRACGPCGALFLAWFWAVFASSFVADALPRSVENYFLQPPVASYVFAIGVWTVTGSFYYMAFAPVSRGIWRRRSAVVAPLLVGAGWAFFELLRGRLLNGSGFFVANPWALVAYSQVGWHAFTQLASVTGVYGLSFLIASVNAGVAQIVAELHQKRRVDRGDMLALLIPLGLATSGVVYGTWVLGEADEVREEAGVPVAIVQGDIDMGVQWRRDYYGRNLDAYLELTYEALARRDARIAFWPEAALTFFLEEEPAYRRAIARVLRPFGAELVTGGPRRLRQDEGAERYSNSVFLVEPQGDLRGHYDKRHLLPFTEFYPLPDFAFLRRRFERVRAYEHGRPTPPLETRAGRAGVLVCNEAMFPEAASARVHEGAEYLVSPSNDSWIDDEKWADRMFDLVSLRAVEQRRYLVRASTAGPSAIVDPWGRVQARSKLFEADVIHGEIRPRSDVSPYGRLGDAFGIGCGVAALGGALLGRARLAT